MTERLPPHDLAAEESVIGSLLIDPNAIFEVSNLQPIDFYSERNLLCYEACLSLYQRNEPINQITVATELSRLNRLETIGGAAYLTHLISICPTSQDIESYAAIVSNLATHRRLINAAAQISELGYKTDPDASVSLNKAEELLYKLQGGEGKTEGFKPLRNILDSMLSEEMDTGTGDVSNSNFTTVLTGFTDLDQLIGGLSRDDLIILAGRPSMGKTSLALNIARNVALVNKQAVAFYSLEMSEKELGLRAVASEASIPYRDLKYRLTEGIDQQHEKQFMEAIGILAEAPIYIDDSPRLKTVDIRSRLKRLTHRQDVKLVIVDHLGLIRAESNRNDNRNVELGRIVEELKAIAKEFSVPMLVCCQLNRANTMRARDDRQPELNDLRESGRIEEAADVVIFIHREEYYYRTQELWEREHPGQNYPPPAEIIIAKQRNGPRHTIKLHYSPHYMRFSNPARELEL